MSSDWIPVSAPAAPPDGSASAPSPPSQSGSPPSSPPPAVAPAPPSASAAPAAAVPGWTPTGQDQPLSSYQQAQWRPAAPDLPEATYLAGGARKPAPVTAPADTRGIYDRTRDLLFGHAPQPGDTDNTWEPGILPSVGGDLANYYEQGTSGPAWSTLAKAYPHELAAQGHKLAGGYEEMVGEHLVNPAEQTLAALHVLPQVAARTPGKGFKQGDIAIMAKDPLVQRAARGLGIDPAAFAAQWTNRDYAFMTDDQRANLAAAAQQQYVQNGPLAQRLKTAGAQQRAQAWATEKAWAPTDLMNGKLQPNTVKGLAWDIAAGLPQLAAAVTATAAGTAVGGPAGGMAAGAVTMAALGAPAQREDAKNAVEDQVDRLHEAAIEADNQVRASETPNVKQPWTTPAPPTPQGDALRQRAAILEAQSDHIANTAASLYAIGDVAGAMPVESILAKSAAGKLIMDRIVGAALAKSVGGRLAGTMVANGAGGIIQAAVQKAVDVGVVHEKESLQNAMQDIARTGVVTALTAASLGAHSAVRGASAEAAAARSANFDDIAGRAQDLGTAAMRGVKPGETYPGYTWDDTLGKYRWTGEGAPPSAPLLPGPVPRGTSAPSGETNQPPGGTKGPAGETNQAAGATEATAAPVGAAAQRAAFQAKQDTLNTAAAAAEKRSDVTLEPEEQGWSVHVKGQPVAHFETADAARAAMAQARKLVGTKPAPAPTAQAAGIPPGSPAAAGDRRQDLGQRKSADEMTPEDFKAAYHTHELTGLPNRRAYEASPKKPVQISSDVDSLAWINDEIGHSAGDTLLKTVAQAMKEAAGPDAYHLSGDEFALQADNETQADEILGKVEKRLANATLEFDRPDGSKISIKGIGLSHGLGNDYDEADQHLRLEKAAREAQGLRAPRKVQPPNAVITAPGAGLQAAANRPTTEVLGQKVTAPAIPTPAQAQAGNYAKPTVDWNGLKIRIENKKGSFRKGVDAKGRPWRSKLHAPYGYFGETEAADGDHFDVFTGEHPESKTVYVIDQLTPDGKSYDEGKAVVGASSEAQARELYLKHYPKGWKGLGAISALPVDEFKRLLKSPAAKKPFAWQPKGAKPKKLSSGPVASRDSILEYLARHARGLSKSEAERQGIDKEDMNSEHARVGIRRAFRKGGMTFDEAAEHLFETGYPVINREGRYDPNVLLDRIGDELAGHKHYSHENSTYTDALLDRFDRHQDWARIMTESEVAALSPQDQLERLEMLERLQAIGPAGEHLVEPGKASDHSDTDLDDIPFARPPGFQLQSPRGRAGGGADKAAPKAGEQQDLFGNRVALANEIAKMKAAIDQKLSSGQVSAEIGKTDDLFSLATKQTDLTAPERKDVQAIISRELVRFASGMSRLGDLASGTWATSAGRHFGVGVDVGELSSRGMREIARAVVDWGNQVFIDSGAFSLFRRNQREDGLVKSLDFDKVLERYATVMDLVGERDRAEENKGRILFVMPDIVGDQAGSIALATRYKDWIKSHAGSDRFQAIVPIQRGELSLAESYERIVAAVGTDKFIVGIPSNEKAVTQEDLREFLNKAKPERVHFLGALSDKALAVKIAAIARAGIEAPQVSADANLLRSTLYGKQPEGMTRREAVIDTLERKAIEHGSEETAQMRRDREELKRRAESPRQADLATQADQIWTELDPVDLWQRSPAELREYIKGARAGGHEGAAARAQKMLEEHEQEAREFQARAEAAHPVIKNHPYSAAIRPRPTKLYRGTESGAAGVRRESLDGEIGRAIYATQSQALASSYGGGPKAKVGAGRDVHEITLPELEPQEYGYIEGGARQGEPARLTDHLGRVLHSYEPTKISTKGEREELRRVADAHGIKVIVGQPGSVAENQVAILDPDLIAARTLTKAGGKLDDVGAKIGGARKDKWAARGLSLQDLDSMTESEAANLVTKAEVWKPDYPALLERTTPMQAALTKILYDKLAAKPRENTPAGRRAYVEAMQVIRRLFEEAGSVDDLKTIERRFALAVGANEHMRFDTDEGRRRFWSVMKGRRSTISYGWAESSAAGKLIATGWPNAAPWTRRFNIRPQYPAHSAESAMLMHKHAEELGTPVPLDSFHRPTFIIKSKGGKTVGFAETEEAARAVAAKAYEQAQAGGDGEETEMPERPHLDAVERKGPDVRVGDVSAHDFMTHYGFRGVEFGNWAASDERQRLVNMAYDALSDLAGILKVPARALSLNGSMGLAIGARGGGRFAAHYEPGRLVINMTKINGAGALAHEWAHAFDHYMGEIGRPDAYQTTARGATGWRSMPTRRQWEHLRPEMQAAWSDLMKAMFQRDTTQAERIRDFELMIERREGQVALQVDRQERGMARPPEQQNPKWLESNARWIRDERASLARARATLETMRAAPEAPGTYGTQHTDYSKEASKLSGSGDYWSRPTEMFARAFESFIEDKIKERGGASQYLVHGTEADRYASSAYKGNPYPAQDRPAINAAIQKLVDTIETRNEGDHVIMFARPPRQTPIDLSVAEGEHPARYEEVQDKSGAGGKAKRNVRAAAAVPGQLDIFANAANPEPAAKAVAAAVPLSQTTRLSPVGKFHAGLTHVRSFRGAAHILAPLRKSAQETVAALVLDKDERPLAVIRHSIGAVDASSVEVWSLAGGVAQVPGAASVYFVHNHPSGNLEASNADRNITYRLQAALRDSGIHAHGMLIVRPGGTQATFIDPIRRRVEETAFDVAKHARTKGSVPVLERQIRGRTPNLPLPIGMRVGGPAQGKLAVKKAIEGGTRSGVMLLNHQHVVIGLLPMNQKTMMNLRTNDPASGAARLMSLAAHANTPVLLIFGERDAARNLGSFAQVAFPRDRPSHTPLDIVIVGPDGGLQSEAEQGHLLMTDDGTWMRRGAAPGTGMDPADVLNQARAIIEDFSVKPAGVVVAGTLDDLKHDPQVGHYLRHEQEGDVIGFYLPATRKIYLVASQIHSEAHLAGLIAHEYVVHFGLRAMLGNRFSKDYQAILRGVAQAMPAAVRARGEQEFGEAYDPANLEHFSIAAEETLAYYSEAYLAGDNIPSALRRLFDRLRGLLRSWWRDLRGLPEKFDELFVRNTLNGLDEWLRRGGGGERNEGSDAAPSFANRAETFYSGLARAVDAAKREKGTGAEWEATLRNMPGVKAEELEWVGIKDWLQGRGRVTKAELADYVRKNRVRLQEIHYGAPDEDEGKPQIFAETIERIRRLGFDVEADDMDGSPRLEPNGIGGFRDWDDEGYEHAFSVATRLLDDALSAPAQQPPLSEQDLAGIRSWLLERQHDLLSEDDQKALLAGGPGADAPLKTLQQIGYPMDSLPKVDETALAGPTKFHDYATPGGERYREMLLTLPPSPEQAQSEADHAAAMEAWRIAGRDSANAEHAALSSFGDELNLTPLERANLPGWIADASDVDHPNIEGHALEKIGKLLDRRPAHLQEHSRLAVLKAIDAAKARRAAYAKTMETRQYLQVAPKFESSHWDPPNVVAHIRFDDRTGENDQRILHIHEIQSDWHQAGRKQGYRGQSLAEVQAFKEEWKPVHEAARAAVKRADNFGFDSPALALGAVADHADWYDRWEVDSKADRDIIAHWRAMYHSPLAVLARTGSKDTVPDAPFKTTWPELAIKRMLRYAVDGNYDELTWDTGSTSAERFNLQKVVDELRIAPQTDSRGQTTYSFDGTRHGTVTIAHHALTEQELAAYLGKDIVRQVLEARDKPMPPIEVRLVSGPGTAPRWGLFGGGERLDGLYGTESGAQRAARHKEDDQRVITLSGKSLQVGGAGMRAFYDNILPKTVNNLVKKWGAKVENGELPTEGWSRFDVYNENGEKLFEGNSDQQAENYIAEQSALAQGEGKDPPELKVVEVPHAGVKIPVHRVRITPAMRDSVAKGLPLFRRKRPPGGVPQPRGRHLRKVYDAGRRAIAAIPENEFSLAFRRIVAPATVDADARSTALVTREALGDLAHRTNEALHELDTFSKAFDLLGHQDRLQFIYAMEAGKPQPHPELQPAADVIRKMLDVWRERVQSLGIGALDSFIDNYFPHIWKDPKGASTTLGKAFGRRPLKGSAAFLKQRSIPTTEEGIAAGLEPVSTNPLILAFAKIREMARFYTGVKLMQRFKDEGLAVFLRSGKPMPPGWHEIEDAVGRVRQWSDEEQGFIERGRYIMPEGAARVINNHLSGSALRNFLPAVLFRSMSNAVTALQLGFSMFHLGFTTLDAIISKNALGIERLLRGEPLRAAASFLEAATGPGAALANIRRGMKLMNAYSNVSGATPQMQRIVEGLMAAGGRIRMGNEYRIVQGGSPFTGVGLAGLARDVRQALTLPSGRVEAIGKTLASFPLQYATRLWRDLEAMWHELDLPALQMPFEIAGRVTRASTSIIMEHIVPLQKLGVFSDLAGDHVRRNPDEDPVAFAAAMQRIWNSVDNRLGEMVYDNVFWNRTFKDVMHMAVRAVGWNVGTVQEIAGAPVDVLKLIDYMARGAPPELAAPGLSKTAQARTDWEAQKTAFQRIIDKVGHKIPYTIALVATTMVLGAILTRLFTGKGPERLKDYFFPPTGRLTKYGTPERMSMPTYTEDVYEYGTMPLQTVINKANPIFGIIHSIYANEDFYGNAIRNPDAGSWEQLREGAMFALRQSQPFSVQGTRQYLSGDSQGADGSEAAPSARDRVLSAIPPLGFGPAPARITSPEQMDRFQHLEDQKKYLRGLEYRLRQARSQGDQDLEDELKNEVMGTRKAMRETERQIRSDRARAISERDSQGGSDQSAKIGALIQGKSRSQAAASLSAAGMPALADLWASLPEQPRARVIESLKGYAGGKV